MFYFCVHSWIGTAYGVSAMTRKWIVQGSGALIQYDARGSRPSEGRENSEEKMREEGLFMVVVFWVVSMRN